MNQSSLVAQRAVAAHEDVGGDSLPENLDFEYIGDDLLCLSVDVRVHEGNVVVACDHIPEGGESLLNSLERNRVW